MKYNALIIIAFLVSSYHSIQAQSTDDKVKQLTKGITSFSGGTDEEIKRNIGVEKHYLELAKQNIEKYRKGNATVLITDDKGKPVKNLKIELNQTTQDFLFGNLSEEVINLLPEEAIKFEERFVALFNFTELTVKWEPYEPKQGKPEWQKLQEKLDWCLKNNITPKGHTLGWTHRAGTPDWLLKLPLEMANELYKARIHNLVGGFKNQIKIWDVVNEPVNTIPWESALKDTIYAEAKIDDGVRYNTENITLEETLPWIEKSFEWAAEANKNGDFILNEFYLIAKPDIREKFYLLLKELKNKNIPVTGIGIQAHEPREMWFSPIDLIKTYDRMNEFGLPLHITEFIPQSSGKTITGGWREGTWTENAQAEFAEQFYTLTFGYPSIASIHWWGLSDKNIWLKGGGLLDKEYNPKPVYNRLLKLIKEDWMTKNLKMKSNHKGEVSFRGFYGDYEVEIEDESGNVYRKNVHLKEGSENIFTFNL
jgi:GH35 family endo-1,4-beta-xylanase